MPAMVRGEEPGGGLFWAPLSRAGRVALYLQIAERLRLAISQGERRLPTERQLADGFTVARVTVRAALALLAADDLISRRRRHGTVVRTDLDRANGDGREWSRLD